MKKMAVLLCSLLCLVVLSSAAFADVINLDINYYTRKNKNQAGAIELKAGNMYFTDMGTGDYWFWFTVETEGVFHIDWRTTSSTHSSSKAKMELRNQYALIQSNEGKIQSEKGLVLDAKLTPGKYYLMLYTYVSTDYSLSICGPDKHVTNLTEWITEKEATCTEDGLSIQRCETCGEIVNSQTLPATGHTPGKEVVLTEPTCIQEGLKGIQCTVCKTILSSEIIPTADHKPGKFETIVEPTCTSEGLSRQTCIVCHEILDEKPVPAAGHQPGEWNVLTQPTCTEEGIRARTCSVCGEVLEMGAVPALGHSFGSWTVTQMPTATEPGIQSRTCSRCGETEMKALVLQPSGDSQEQMDISTASGADIQNGKPKSSVSTEPSYAIQVTPDNLTGPGEVSVSLRVYNNTGEDMVFPVTLLDPDGNVVTSFGDGGSYIFKSGDSRSWEGKWNVTQAQLDAGAVGYTLRYHEEDASGSLVETKKKVFAKIAFAGERVSLSVNRTITPEVVRNGGQATVKYELYNNGNANLTDIRVQENISKTAKTVETLAAGERATVEFSSSIGNADLISNATITYKVEGSAKTEKITVEDAIIPLANPTAQTEALNVEAKDDSKEIPSEIIAENSPAPIQTDATGVTRVGTFVPGFSLTPEELGEKCEMLINRINNEMWKNIPIDLRDFPIQIDPAAILQTLIPEIVAGEKGNRRIKVPYFTDNGWVLSVPTKGEEMWHRQEEGYLREGDDWYDDELCFRGIFEYYTEKGTLKFYLEYDENLTLQSFFIDYRPSTDNMEMEFSYRSSRPLLTIISNEAWFDVSFFSYDKPEFGFEVEYDLDGKMVQLATEKTVKTETYSADRTDTYSVKEIKKLQGVPAKPIPGFAVDPEKAKEVLSIVAEEAPFWTDTTAPQTLNEFPLLPTMDITVSPPLNIIETDDSVILENHSVIPLTAGLLSGYRKNGMRFNMEFVSRVEPNESLYLAKEDSDIGSVDSCVMYALYSFDREDFDYSINWGSGYINSISYMLTKDRSESLDESYLSLWCGEAPGHNISISWDYSPFNGYYHIQIRIDHEITVELDYDIDTLLLLSLKQR